MKSTYAVNVELVISMEVEADNGDHAAEIVADFDFPLGKEILQRIEAGDYTVQAIETGEATWLS